MTLKLSLSMLLLLLFGCNKAQKLETVTEVDIAKYMGKWYEIASFPNSFQKGCHCTTAEYELVPGKAVKVINTCHKDSIHGKISRIEGKAFVVKGSGNARLKVQFFWPFRGDYWIIDLAPDYSYAVGAIQTGNTFGSYAGQHRWMKQFIPVSSSGLQSKDLISAS